MEDNLEKAVSYLKNELSPIAIYLFGSHAEGTQDIRSDYDFAVLCPTEIDLTVLKQVLIKVELEKLLSNDVDLVILNQASPILAMQAVTKGKLLLETDSQTHHNWVASLYSTYAELKEMRKPMEKNILKRKYYDR